MSRGCFRKQLDLVNGVIRGLNCLHVSWIRDLLTCFICVSVKGREASPVHGLVLLFSAFVLPAGKTSEPASIAEMVNFDIRPYVRFKLLHSVMASLPKV